MNLEQMIDNHSVWRAGRFETHTVVDGVATGFQALDGLLSGGGLPLGALTELLTDEHGSSALQILLPALAELSQQGRWIAMVAPPHIPYAPALAAHGVDVSKILLIHPKSADDALWATEQALKAGTCGAVLTWPGQVNERQLRRLQLAAESGHAVGLLFHTDQQRTSSTPAALRLQVSPSPGGVQVNILKRRGGWPTGPIALRSH